MVSLAFSPFPAISWMLVLEDGVEAEAEADILMVFRAIWKWNRLKMSIYGQESVQDRTQKSRS